MAHESPHHVRNEVSSEARRLGRRGAALIALGMVFVFYGLGQIATSSELSPTAGRSLHLALEIAPLWVWGVAWVACGLVAVVASHWPPGRDGIGFLALSGLSTWWSMVYFTGWVFSDAERAWTGFAVWAIVVILLQILAGWPEPRSTTRAQVHDRFLGL